jgi:hypothetical protein
MPTAEEEAPRMTGGHATITEYFASGSPRVYKARKFEVVGPFRPVRDDIDMSGAKELRIYTVAPRKRNWSWHGISLLSGTAIGYNNHAICYDRNSHYLLIEHGGKVLFDSRNVFPCDMQKFAENRENHIAASVARGWTREQLQQQLDTPDIRPAR